MQRYIINFYLNNLLIIFCKIFCVKFTFIFFFFSNFYRIYSQQITLEAESATLRGSLTKQTIYNGYSGTGYVGNFSSDEDKIIFKFKTDSAGYYNLYIRYIAPYGFKINVLYVNDNSIEVSFPECTKFSEICFGRVKLLNDTNSIIISKSWGWFFIDCIKLVPTNESLYNFSLPYKLSTPDPSDESLRLFHFLCSKYEKNIISGVMEKSEADWLKIKTGKYPALLGQDFMNHTRSYTWYNKNEIINNAISWYNQNGIVTICWHWRDPSRNTEEFYSSKTNFDVLKIFDTTSNEYKWMIQDIDTIANYLKKLKDARVPILFRPLHEASGQWFWWGAKGPEPCKELWKIMFNRIVRYHNINNLIWVWTSDVSQNNLQWYPGDSIVDIIGLDVYSNSGDYSSKILYYEKIKESFQAKKIITLSENGVIPDPDLLIKDGAYFSYFMTWYGTFVRDSSINPLSHWIKVLNHSFVITLDEMPNLKTYPLLDIKQHSYPNNKKFVIKYFNEKVIISPLEDNLKYYNLSIYDMYGKEILYKNNLLGNFSLNNLKQGIYLIKVFSDSTNEIHKIVIKK